MSHSATKTPTNLSSSQVNLIKTSQRLSPPISVSTQSDLPLVLSISPAWSRPWLYTPAADSIFMWGSFCFSLTSKGLKRHESHWCSTSKLGFSQLGRQELSCTHTQEHIGLFNCTKLAGPKGLVRKSGTTCSQLLARSGFLEQSIPHLWSRNWLLALTSWNAGDKLGRQGQQGVLNPSL